MRFTVSVVIAVTWLLVWQTASAADEVKFLFSSPMEVWNKLRAETVSINLPFHACITAAEAGIGAILGISCGILAGFVLWLSPSFASILKPYLFVLSAVPIVAFAPMVIVWFGIGFEMKVLMAAISSFVATVYSVYDGTRVSNDSMKGYFEMLGVTRLRYVRVYLLPESLNWLLASLGSSTKIAILGAFLGELVASNQGLGYFMSRSGSLYDVGGVLAGAVYLTSVAIAFQLFVTWLERRRLTIARFVSRFPA